MLQNVPEKILKRMQWLEELNQKEKTGEISIEHFDRLRQIPPETGRFLFMMALCAPEGNFIEIGTSAGYSTLWITLACLQLNNKTITTFELDKRKIGMAKETFEQADVSKYIHLIEGNVLDHLTHYHGLTFCFLDTEKSLYLDCYETIIPNMKKGGLLLADNVISHQTDLMPMIDRVIADNRMCSMIVPIGQGILLSKKL